MKDKKSYIVDSVIAGVAGAAVLGTVAPIFTPFLVATICTTPLITTYVVKKVFGSEDQKTGEGG